MLQQILCKRIPAKQKKPNNPASLKIDRLNDKTFPTDLLDVIFKYLTIEDITKLRIMNRFFRDFVDSYKALVTKIPRIKYNQINSFSPNIFRPSQSNFSQIDLLTPDNFELLQLPPDTKLSYSDMIKKVREAVLRICQQRRISSKKDAAELYRRNGEIRESCIMYTCIYALGCLLVLFKEPVLNLSRNPTGTLLLLFLISFYIFMVTRVKKAIQRIPNVAVGKKRYFNAIKTELDRIEDRFTVCTRSDLRSMPRSSLASHPIQMHTH